MKIVDKKLQQIIKSTIVDINNAYRNAYSNYCLSRQYLCNAESRLQTMLDLIDWSENNEDNVN